MLLDRTTSPLLCPWTSALLSTFSIPFSLEISRGHLCSQSDHHIHDPAFHPSEYDSSPGATCSCIHKSDCLRCSSSTCESLSALQASRRSNRVLALPLHPRGLAVCRCKRPQVLMLPNAGSSVSRSSIKVSHSTLMPFSRPSTPSRPTRGSHWYKATCSRFSGDVLCPVPAWMTVHRIDLWSCWWYLDVITDDV